MSLARSIVRYGYVPFMFIVLPLIAYTIVSNGYSYFLLVPFAIATFAIAFVAEKIAPFFEEWTDHHEHGDGQANFLHILAYEWSSLSGVMLIPVITWLFPFQGLWPITWPLWAQAALAFLIADIAFTVVHYWSHRYPTLWRLHSVHHGAGRLYGFNGVIRHPLHQTVDMVVGTLPLVIMGMPVDVAILLGFMITTTLVVQHSNVDARLGPFEGWFSIGRLHHLHHVNWGTEGDCNFALFLTLWDRILGTYNPTPSKPITAKDMGIDEVPNFPRTSFLEQIIFPFIYKPGEGEPERYKKARPTPAQQAKQQLMSSSSPTVPGE